MPRRQIWDLEMFVQGTGQCQFCGGDCPGSPLSPSQACCCYERRDSNDQNETAKATGPRNLGGSSDSHKIVKNTKVSNHLNSNYSIKDSQTLCCNIGLQKNSEANCSISVSTRQTESAECDCVRLRQLCYESYAKFIHRVQRFENWHISGSSPSSSDGGREPSPSNLNDRHPDDWAMSPASSEVDTTEGKAERVNNTSGTNLPYEEAKPTRDGAQSSNITALSNEAAVVGDSCHFWVFGYGSLVWKTDGLPAQESIPGFVKGFKRVFFQLSDDHRGTRSSPGLVANLLPLEVYKDFVSKAAAVAQAKTRQRKNELLEASDKRSESNNSCLKWACEATVGHGDEGIVHGVALKFAAADLETVISKLDYREKGGYSRILVEFFPLEYHQKQRGRTITAFVYVGLPCNRYFYCFPDFPLTPATGSSNLYNDCGNCNENCVDIPVKLSRNGNPQRSKGNQAKKEICMQEPSKSALLCRCCTDDLDHAAGMIVRGEGLSGPNTEYLFNLADFLRNIRREDEHVFNLEARVKQIMQKETVSQSRISSATSGREAEFP